MRLLIPTPRASEITDEAVYRRRRFLLGALAAAGLPLTTCLPPAIRCAAANP
jgi:hypothetical protein